MTTDKQLLDILKKTKTIAVVGASTNAEKPSHQVPADLIRAGYTIIPVHPKADEIFGQRAYPKLADIPGPVDMVNVFRPSAEIPDITRQALAINAPVIWVQKRIFSDEAAQLAEDAGVTYLENICLGVEVKRLNVAPVSDAK